ncbi:MAG: cardiolipin synthase [Gemmatimonadales bacterium]|nr:MAG: cardiolipin synthase [Gemmatimonadales bacterium]
MVTLLIVLALAHLVGLITAGAALLTPQRSAEGSVAWILSLITLPWIAVPAYWLFGRPRFLGYRTARHPGASPLREAVRSLGTHVEAYRARLPEERGGVQAVERLVQMPFLRGNSAELLIDGEETFRSLFEGFNRAEHYLLVQFYIIRDDRMGQELKRRLIERAEGGVRVHLLYDKIGSFGLPGRYVDELREAGVKVRAFRSNRRTATPLQINFRNHRKVTVVDGCEGWVGGLNVGDEYLEGDEDLGHWRDTHLHLEGPAVLGLQLSFLEDWYWMTDEVLDLRWEPRSRAGDLPALILPSGPADELETASLLMQHAIHSAVKRVWISSPYFVPDEGVMAALELAVLRGVDVRILVPRRADVLLVHLAKFAFLERLLRAGVQVFAYQPGVLHSKTLLLDSEIATVGTVNLDNRSLRLNFEITALVVGREFADQVRQSFEDDFRRSRPFTLEEIAAKPLWFRVASHGAHLFSPLL